MEWFFHNRNHSRLHAESGHKKRFLHPVIPHHSLIFTESKLVFEHVLVAIMFGVKYVKVYFTAATQQLPESLLANHVAQNIKRNTLMGT